MHRLTTGPALDAQSQRRKTTPDVMHSQIVFQTVHHFSVVVKIPVKNSVCNLGATGVVRQQVVAVNFAITLTQSRCARIRTKLRYSKTYSSVGQRIQAVNRSHVFGLERSVSKGSSRMPL